MKNKRGLKLVTSHSSGYKTSLDKSDGIYIYIYIYIYIHLIILLIIIVPERNEKFLSSILVISLVAITFFFR